MAYHRILIGWVEGKMQAGKGEQVALIKKAATILEAIPLDKSGTGFMQASMNPKSSIHINPAKVNCITWAIDLYSYRPGMPLLSASIGQFRA